MYSHSTTILLVEPQTRGGGGLITEDVCAILFSHDNIVSRYEIMKLWDVGGKNILQI